MNYIKRLETDLRERVEQAETVRERVVALERYLSSPKFFSGDPLDGYVSVADVLPVLRELKGALA